MYIHTYIPFPTLTPIFFMSPSSTVAKKTKSYVEKNTGGGAFAPPLQVMPIDRKVSLLIGRYSRKPI